MVPSLLFVHLFECELPVVKFWAVVTGNPTTPYYHTGLAYLRPQNLLIPGMSLAGEQWTCRQDLSCRIVV
ncbi:hypothetical protein PAXRUDRAFT_833105, partial [Paxillus rubicundulus Ve08.2h10]